MVPLRWISRLDDAEALVDARQAQQPGNRATDDHLDVGRLEHAAALDEPHRVGVADGDELVVSTDAGSIRLPVVITPMTDNVVWLPTNSADSHVRRSLHADHGSIVTIAGGNA